MSRRNKPTTANRAICQSTVREQTSGASTSRWWLIQAGLIKGTDANSTNEDEIRYFICGVLLSPFGKHHHTRGEEGYFYDTSANSQRHDLVLEFSREVAADGCTSMGASRGDRVKNIGGLAVLQFASAVTAHHVLVAVLRVRQHRVRFAILPTQIKY